MCAQNNNSLLTRKKNTSLGKNFKLLQKTKTVRKDESLYWQVMTEVPKLKVGYKTGRQTNAKF